MESITIRPYYSDFVNHQAVGSRWIKAEGNKTDLGISVAINIRLLATSRQEPDLGMRNPPVL